MIPIQLYCMSDSLAAAVHSLTCGSRVCGMIFYLHIFMATAGLKYEFLLD